MKFSYYLNYNEQKVVQGVWMKSITIHNLDDSLDTLIRKKAKKNGLSLNKTIQMLLKESLGLKTKEVFNHKSDFVELCGAWNEKDKIDFQEKVSDLNEVNEMDWE